MKFKWEQSLMYGVEPMDSEHERIINQVDALYDAIQNHESDEVILETIKFLSKYVEEHFDSEEKLQKKYAYPEIESHKQIHTDFKKLVGDLIDEVKTKGLTAKRKIEINKMVLQWLRDHIAKDDKIVAEHIKSSGYK